MCFVLFVASHKKPPLIPWNKDTPGLCTQELTSDEEKVSRHFNLPVMTYIGSDQSCGCGFRHLSPADQGEGIEEIYIEFMDEPEASRRNHNALAKFLKDQFASESYVELYGCWSGDEGKPANSRREIAINQLASDRFCFREQAYYRVHMVDS